MHRILIIIGISIFFTTCNTTDKCSDGLQNQDETDIDCGGVCGPCPNCLDDVQNFAEAGVDCGGNCEPC